MTHFRVHDDDANTEQDVAIKADLSSWEDEGLVGEGEMMKVRLTGGHRIPPCPHESHNLYVILEEESPVWIKMSTISLSLASA